MQNISIAAATILCMTIAGATTFGLPPVALAKQIDEVTPVPKDIEWWQAKHAQNNQIVQNGTIDTVIYGDSITEFMNEQSMHKILGEKTQNIGIKGDKTEHLLWRLQNGEADFKKQQPKIALVLIGTNNFSHSKTNEIAEGVQADVNEIRKRLPSTKILIVGILPRGETATAKIRGEVAKTNLLLAKLADQKSVWYTDIGKSLLQPDGSIAKNVMDDFLHPTKDIGYTKMLEALKPEVDKVLASTTH